MKTIRSLFMAVIAITLSLHTQAQFSAGVEGGLNVSHTDTRLLGQSISTTSVAAYHVGGIANWNFLSMLAFQPELLFSRQGMNYSASGVTDKDRLSYLKLPLNVVYRIPLGSGHLFAGLGPYFAWGLGGKRTTTVSAFGVTSTSKANIKFGDDAQNDNYRTMDDGLNFKIGYILDNGFLVSAQYSLGLKNLEPGGDDNNYYRMRNFGLSIGYLWK